MNYFLRLFKNSYYILVLVFFSCDYEHGKDNSNQHLYYNVTGDGKPAIVMLHGLLGSHRYWDGVVPELSRDHELILIDLLGFGESQKPQLEYSVVQHIAKIEDVIEQVQLKKINMS